MTTFSVYSFSIFKISLYINYKKNIWQDFGAPSAHPAPSLRHCNTLVFIYCAYTFFDFLKKDLWDSMGHTPIHAYRHHKEGMETQMCNTYEVCLLSGFCKQKSIFFNINFFHSLNFKYVHIHT